MDRTVPIMESKKSITYRADAGCIKFILRTTSTMAKFALMSKDNPNKSVFEIVFSEVTSIKHVSEDYMSSSKQATDLFYGAAETNEAKVWVTWFHGLICVGTENDIDRVTVHEYDSNKRATKPREMIGYIKFYTVFDNTTCKWFYDEPPIDIKPIMLKQISKGKLRWEKVVDGKLPKDALIGGFQDEPIYIARAFLPDIEAMLPGKYVPSLKTAYFAWRNNEIIITNFVVLCGYDAVWVKSKEKSFPQNAFSGGTYERNHEPLYIGRTQIEDHLICGKINGDNICCVPYKQKEYCSMKYEILVSCNEIPRGQENECEEANGDEATDNAAANRRVYCGAVTRDYRPVFRMAGRGIPLLGAGVPRQIQLQML